MKKIQCEVCGSTQVKKIGDDLFECQSCGVQYTQEDIKKLLVEISGEVKIDKTKETENTLKLAYDAYNGGNYQQAYSYFSITLQNDYGNPDATFMKGLSSAYQSTLAKVNASELIKSSQDAIKLFELENTSDLERAAFRTRIASEIIEFTISLHNISLKHYNEFHELKTAAFEFLNRTYLFVQLAGFADEILNKSMFISYPKSMEIGKRIIHNGLILCDLVKQNIQYKSGSMKMSSWVDGSTYYQDIIGNAQLGDEQVKNVEVISDQLSGTQELITRALKDKEDQLAAEKEAQQKKYWEDHPEEYQEMIFQNAQTLKDRCHSEQEYKSVAGTFRSIAGYKNADVLAVECERLADLARVAQEQEDEKRKIENEAEQARNAIKEIKKKKLIKIIAFASLLILIAFALYKLVVVPEIKYKTAQNLLSQGQFSLAIDSFSKLGKYKNSQEMIREAKYQEANNYLTSGQLPSALELFTEIKDYKDSSQMILEVKYQDAQLLLKNKSLDKALSIFSELGSYKDSSELIDVVRNTQYKEAETLLKKGQYFAAIQEFSKLSNFKDSNDRIAESQNLAYEKALSMFEQKSYQISNSLFMQLGNYKDSKKYLLYTLARELYSTDNESQEAYSVFMGLGDFLDSLAYLEMINWTPKYKGYWISSKHNIDGFYTVINIGTNPRFGFGASFYSSKSRTKDLSIDGFSYDGYTRLILEKDDEGNECLSDPYGKFYPNYIIKINSSNDKFTLIDDDEVVDVFSKIS